MCAGFCSSVSLMAGRSVAGYRFVKTARATRLPRRPMSMTGYDADASSALTTLADVFQLLIQSHIMCLHTAGNIDKTDP